MVVTGFAADKWRALDLAEDEQPPPHPPVEIHPARERAGQVPDRLVRAEAQVA